MSDQQPPPFGENGDPIVPPGGGTPPPETQHIPAYAEPYQAPQQPYGQPAYGQGFVATSQSLGKATTSMVLGIIGLATIPICGVLLTLFLSPTAFFMGRSAAKEIEAAPGRYTNGGQAKAGWIMGVVGIVLTVIGIVLIAALIAVGAFSESDF